MKTLITLPFSGFYYSMHSDCLERNIDMMLEEGELDESFDFSQVDTIAAHRDYAQGYAEHILDALKVSGKFESLDSPKFYNYTTDRIFVDLTESEVTRLIGLALQNASTLAKLVEDNFTSGPGFSSFYSNDVHEWIERLQNDPEDLDHNELGIVLQSAHPEADFDELAEDYAEYMLGNSGGYADYFYSDTENA